MWDLLVTQSQLSNGVRTHGREAKRGGHICTVVADSHYRAAESNTTLNSDYPPIKNLKKIVLNEG